MKKILMSMALTLFAMGAHAADDCTACQGTGHVQWTNSNGETYTIECRHCGGCGVEYSSLNQKKPGIYPKGIYSGVKNIYAQDELDIADLLYAIPPTATEESLKRVYPGIDLYYYGDWGEKFGKTNPDATLTTSPESRFQFLFRDLVWHVVSYNVSKNTNSMSKDELVLNMVLRVCAYPYKESLGLNDEKNYRMLSAITNALIFFEEYLLDQGRKVAWVRTSEEDMTPDLYFFEDTGTIQKIEYRPTCFGIDGEAGYIHVKMVIK